MSNHYDTQNIYQFLTQTPEAGLRQMLTDPKSFPPAHFQMMIKVVRACNEKDFGDHWTAGTFPKLKWNAGELAIKETFWKACEKIWLSRGLLSPATPAKAA